MKINKPTEWWYENCISFQPPGSQQFRYQDSLYSVCTNLFLYCKQDFIETHKFYKYLCSPIIFNPNSTEVECLFHVLLCISGCTYLTHLWILVLNTYIILIMYVFQKLHKQTIKNMVRNKVWLCQFKNNSFDAFALL